MIADIAAILTLAGVLALVGVAGIAALQIALCIMWLRRRPP